MKILLVDDEIDIREQLQAMLVEQRYIVDTAADGNEGLDKIFEQSFDLILLDIMLPGIDGLSVLRHIREAGIRTPVLMLTARNGVDDKVEGLDLGADDYLAKPFSAAELLARVRALLRRVSETCRPVLEIEDLRLDAVSRVVRRGGREVELTPKEFSLLEFLLYNKNRAVSRFSLAEHVWGDDFDPFTMSNTIDVHIRNLRRKIGDMEGDLVQSVRGVGYIVRQERR
ncbi:MAG: response regulator transcription factor [Syntrophobacteraceae bacterium]